MLLPSLLLALSVGHPGPDGATLLRQVNATHRGTWWTTLVFEQRSSWPGQPGRAEERWYESMDRPGKLRIDMERRDSAVGHMIFRNDSLYQALPGRPPAPGRAFVHPLLVLLHDIHVGDIEASIAKLTTLGFDLATTDTTTWEGVPVTIVGARAGDSGKPQFWLDTGRGVVVRIMQPGAKGVSDTRIMGFTDTGHGLVERRIEFRSNDVLQMVEEYTWVRTGDRLPASVFDPGTTEWPDWIEGPRGSAASETTNH
jgi:hypothetical protein